MSLSPARVAALTSPRTFHSSDAMMDVGCVLALPMNEGAGSIVHDHSPRSNHGAITGATWTLLADGQWALSFDGNDYLAVDSVLVKLTSAVQGTIELWAEADDITPSGVKSLIAFGDTDAIEIIRIYLQTNGTIEVACYDAGAVQWYFVSNQGYLADNTWFHVVLIQNGVSPTLFINGKEAVITFGDQTDKTRWFSGLTGLDNGRIGCRNMNNLGNGSYWVGTIGEVRIYNRTLGAIEVLVKASGGRLAEVRELVTAR